MVSPTWSTSDAAPSPIKTPPREKTKHPITFPETHRDPPPSSTRDWEGLEALPGTLPERGIATRGLLHRHACLSLIYTSYFVGTLYIHVSLSFSLLFLVLIYAFQNTKRPKIFRCFSLFASLVF
jgi:hypothetical protein